MKKIQFILFILFILFLPIVSAATLTEQIASGASSLVTAGKWISLIILAVVVLGGGWWWWYSRKKWSYIPEIWGSVGGVPDIIQVDKGKGIRIQSTEGVASLLYAKKLKRYLKMPQRDFFNEGKIRFWFRKDGELTPIKPIKIHFYDFGKSLEKKKSEIIKQAEESDELFIPLVLEDVNRKFAVAKVKYIDEDARLTYLSVNRIIRDTWTFQKFWDKHGTTIMAISMLLVFGIVILLILDGFQPYLDKGDVVADKLVELTKTVKDYISGQGPAPITPVITGG
ncbi:MAG TPA: hypothetical protein ENI22_00655 [Candidatus Pacearchaeota archaeon]|nr:hypothetical protein [Candidatus Pacearchaeota archaeon]